MRYSEVERLISLLAAASRPRSRMTLCRHAVRTLTRIDDFDALAELEFTPDAAAAFRAASVAPEAASDEQLTQWIARIDAGTLSDGDMDLAVVRALTALESWRDFLRACGGEQGEERLGTDAPGTRELGTYGSETGALTADGMRTGMPATGGISAGELGTYGSDTGELGTYGSETGEHGTYWSETGALTADGMRTGGLRTETIAVTMAIALLELIDEEIDGADIDDFLANPRMLAEFERIRTMLTVEPEQP